VTPTSAQPTRWRDELEQRMLVRSLELLDDDLPELRAFGDDWKANGLDDPTARALHIAALGDFQPLLFLFAEALDRSAGTAPPALVHAARAAAKRAKSLGLLLIGLHRERSPDAYELAVGSYDLFVEAAAALRDELAGALGTPAADRAPSGAFHRRLLDLRRYCYGGPAEPSGVLAAAAPSPG
jgi:hypothetical protein